MRGGGENVKAISGAANEAAACGISATAGISAGGASTSATPFAAWRNAGEKLWRGGDWRKNGENINGVVARRGWRQAIANGYHRGNELCSGDGWAPWRLRALLSGGGDGIGLGGSSERWLAKARYVRYWLAWRGGAATQQAATRKLALRLRWRRTGVKIGAGIGGAFGVNRNLTAINKQSCTHCMKKKEAISAEKRSEEKA